MTDATADQTSATEEFNVLPLRDIVVFPGMVASIFVGRPKSKQAVVNASGAGGEILFLTQENADEEEPGADKLHGVGTVATLIQVMELPDGTLKVVAEGLRRVHVDHITDDGSVLVAGCTLLQDSDGDPTEIEAAARAAKTAFAAYAKTVEGISSQVAGAIDAMDGAHRIADKIAAHLKVATTDKLALLDASSVIARLEGVIGLMEVASGVDTTDRRIAARVKRQVDKTQREFYLNEQMKAIQAELGQEDGDELSVLRDRVAATKFSKEARTKAEAELKKLGTMNPMSPEAATTRNYLETLLGLPWGKKSKVRADIVHAAKVLEDEHYGLEKVKERILEHLAVQARTKSLAGPVICLVGPPGVGKTSLAKSIATATGRDYVRMALGGVRDEAEIRGHRRTYIGSMPGKILQSLAKVGKTNPLFLLDEIDKMGQDNRGDPSSALLEVLDPSQNNTFSDHYLEVDYDLSDVMFVMTANSMDIPGPLLDRMEVIHLSGYTVQEKHAIAKRHLIPDALKENGLRPGEFTIGDDMLTEVIESYTREAGVRGLKREISKLMRKAVTEIVKSKAGSITVDDDVLVRYLGQKVYRHGQVEGEAQVGLVTGLAWTSVGGELLTIEGVMTPGKGRVTVTGNIKDVMKESVTAATAFVRSRAAEFGIKPPMFDTRDIHIHLPEGATPKDGPSAGIGMATTIISVMTGIAVRHDVAMTGEVTLRGRVLPIGGLKEKLLAALRGGTKTVLIPQENVRDLAEMPDLIKEGLEIIPVTTMDQVIKHALVRQPEPIEWNPDEVLPTQVPTTVEAVVPLAH